MTDEEKVEFLRRGRAELTSFAIHSQHLIDWATVFEENGGGAQLGNDAALIVGFVNTLRDEFLDADNRATIAKFRNDFTGG